MRWRIQEKNEIVRLKKCNRREVVSVKVFTLSSDPNFLLMHFFGQTFRKTAYLQ